MVKEITGVEVRKIFNELMENWETNKTQIKMSPKSLYNLVGLKKALETAFVQANETLILMLESNGATQNAQGGYQIPEEKREEVTKMMNELGETKVPIEYNEIKISTEDSIPVDILDALYDFIDMAE